MYGASTSSTPAHGNQIPTMSHKEIQFMRYRPEAKAFDADETRAVQNFDDRSNVIKEINTAISPFMKNQNLYLQRLQKNVAKQDAIADAYRNSPLKNYSCEEISKNKRIE